MAMQRRRDGKRRTPREKATETGRDNGGPVEKTPAEKRGERENQRRGPWTEIERGRPRDTETECGQVATQTQEGAGRDSPPAPPGGDGGQTPRPADRRTYPAERGRAGSGRGRCPRIPGGAGKGGAGRAARRGRKRRCRAGAGRRQEAGRGGGAGASGKTPQLPAPPEPGSGSRDTGPGIAEPDLGRPAGHLPARTPGTPSVAPPGLLPLAARGSGRRRGGGWGVAGSGGASWGTPESETAPPWASVFPSVKGGPCFPLVL